MRESEFLNHMCGVACFFFLEKSFEVRRLGCRQRSGRVVPFSSQWLLLEMRMKMGSRRSFHFLFHILLYTGLTQYSLCNSIVEVGCLKTGSGKAGEEEPGGGDTGRLWKGPGPRAWPQSAPRSWASCGPSPGRGQVFAPVCVGGGGGWGMPGFSGGTLERLRSC